MARSRRSDALSKRVTDLLTRMMTARSAARSRQLDRILMSLATALFLGGFVIAYVNLPDPMREPVWGLLAVTAVAGVPLTLATNTGEYLVSLKLLGYRVPLEVAVRVSVLAAAANLLPLPGSVLVRTHAIRRLGAKTSRAFGVSTLVGVSWLAVTAVLAGGFLLVYGRLPIGVITVTVGALLLGATWYLFARLTVSRSLRLTARLFLVEIASVLVKAARLYVVFQALRYHVDIDQVLALTMAAVVSTASGFFPGGLGATEVLSAAISPLIGLSPAVSLLVAAIDRLLGIAVLGLLAAVLLVHRPELVEEVAETTAAVETSDDGQGSIPQ
ncbi:MAG: hypothetical protein GEU78_01635 [Actinobacteria bacterium]|nr:hypothetical protein [Actinomycetota bacterium]